MGLSNLRQKASEKADRKFEKKVKFYDKVRIQTIAATQTIKTKSRSARRAKKLKAYDLSILSELLDGLKIEKRVAPLDKFKLNNKSRQKLLLKEGNQFASVVSHPAFHSDPFDAIHQHLSSTQPAIEELEKKKKKKKGTKGKAKKRAKKRAAGSGGNLSGSMKM